MCNCVLLQIEKPNEFPAIAAAYVLDSTEYKVLETEITTRKDAIHLRRAFSRKTRVLRHTFLLLNQSLILNI